LLEYLENEWGQKVALEFLNKIDKRIETLIEQPFIGKPSLRKPEIRTILITKHNRLYYNLATMLLSFSTCTIQEATLKKIPMIIS